MNKAQEFIKIKRRKRMIKRLTLTSILVIIAIVFFIYKSPIFNIKQITFNGIDVANEQELKDGLSKYVGKNIFTVDYKEIKKEILNNPYIKKVSINKKNNSILNVTVEEDKVSYYIQQGDEYKIITNDGVLVEKLTTLEDKNLVKVIGVTDNGREVGQKIIDDENKLRVLSSFSPIIKSNLSDLKIEKLDISNIIYIKGYINGIEIRFGDTSDLVGTDEKPGKIIKVLNTLEQNNITKGYIDVSFNGSPVVKIES